MRDEKNMADFHFIKHLCLGFVLGNDIKFLVQVITFSMHIVSDFEK